MINGPDAISVMHESVALGVIEVAVARRPAEYASWTKGQAVEHRGTVGQRGTSVHPGRADVLEEHGLKGACTVAATRPAVVWRVHCHEIKRKRSWACDARPGASVVVPDGAVGAHCPALLAAGY